MNRHLKWVTSASIAAFSVVVAGNNAIAQEARQRIDADIFPLVTSDVVEQMEDVFYSNDQPYYTNRGIPRQISSFIGTSFVDHEINEDARLIHEFAQQLWEEQARSAPVIRTPDLPNPYQSSILLEPTIAQQEFSSSFVRQPIAAPPSVAVPRTTSSNRPVRALW